MSNLKLFWIKITEPNLLFLLVQRPPLAICYSCWPSAIFHRSGPSVHLLWIRSLWMSTSLIFSPMIQYKALADPAWTPQTQLPVLTRKLRLPNIQKGLSYLLNLSKNETHYLNKFSATGIFLHNGANSWNQHLRLDCPHAAISVKKRRKRQTPNFLKSIQYNL